MFGIGLPELIIILIVALVVVGPKKLPDLARSVGKALHDVKKMTDDVKHSFDDDVAAEATPKEAAEGTGLQGGEASADRAQASPGMAPDDKSDISGPYGQGTLSG